MTNVLLFLVAAALGLWVLWRGSPLSPPRRRGGTLDLTGSRIRFGDREQRS